MSNIEELWTVRIKGDSGYLTGRLGVVTCAPCDYSDRYWVRVLLDNDSQSMHFAEEDLDVVAEYTVSELWNLAYNTRCRLGK